MRTTVTLDSDVAEKLKELARRKRSSFKVTLNEVLRRGLTAQARPSPGARFVVRPVEGGFRPGIDPGRLTQLLDELDADGFGRER